MKIFVMYDDDGNITSLGVPGPETVGQVRLLPEEGQSVAEVDLSELKCEIGDEENPQSLQELLDLADRYRVRFGDKGPFLRQK